jgi:hypothetical protein
MKLKELISFIWNELEIPVTKLELQNNVNELFDEIRNGEIVIGYEQKEPQKISHRRYSNPYV